MATKKNLLGLSSEEINEEINLRAASRAEDILNQVHYFRKPMSRTRVPTLNDEESMTHQAHMDSCDINNIIRQFDRTGSLPPSDKIPLYDDVSSLNKPLSELVVQASSTSSAFTDDMIQRDQILSKRQADLVKQQEVPPSPPPPTKPPVNPELD